MPASTGAVGRAGSARAVHATASASGSRSTWSFTGCLLPESAVMFAVSRGLGMCLAGRSPNPQPGQEPTWFLAFLSYKNVVVIGAVETGETVVGPVQRLSFVHSRCAGSGDDRGGAVYVSPLSPRYPRFLPRFSLAVPQSYPQAVCTALDNSCGLAVCCSSGSRLLLDPVGELGYLGVDGPAFGHQGADLAVRVDNGGVVAAAELLADLRQ